MLNTGGKSTPVYAFADNSMPLDQIDIHQVAGLGNSPSEKGYLIFCNTKCCNEKFFTWFDQEILIPYVKKIKEAYELPLDAQALFFHDGEPV